MRTGQSTIRARRLVIATLLAVSLGSPVAILRSAEAESKAADGELDSDLAPTQPSAPSQSPDSAAAPTSAACPTIPQYFSGQPQPEKQLWPDPDGNNNIWTATDPPALSVPRSTEELYDWIAADLAAPIWPLLGGFTLVLILRKIGLTLTMAGMWREASVRNVWNYCLLLTPLAFIAFWAYGFAIGFGNWFNGPVAPGWYASLGPGMAELNGGIGIGPDPRFEGAFRYSLLGTKGFFMRGLDDPSVVALMLFMAVLLDTAATIPIGALGERWCAQSFCLYSLWVVRPYSLFANWVWGGGWLAQSGLNWGLGHGSIDFGGASVVQGMGGLIGLAGCLVMGRSVQQSALHGPSSPPRGRLVMATAGTATLLLVWTTFACGFDTEALGRAALSSGIAAASAAGVHLAKRKRPDLLSILRGLLSGLVAMTACCPFVDFAGAAVIGAMAGVLCVWSAELLSSLGIDDATGAFSTYGVSGLWGALALGLFANGKYGAGWNGVVRDHYVARYGEDCVRGLFYGDASQLSAQALSVAVEVVVGFGLGYLLFKISKRITPVPAEAATPASPPQPAAGA